MELQIYVFRRTAIIIVRLEYSYIPKLITYDKAQKCKKKQCFLEQLFLILFKIL